MQTRWIDSETNLKGNTVELGALEEKHFPELKKLAEDKRIWKYYTVDCCNPQRFSQILAEAVAEKEGGAQFPFVIYHKADMKIIGSTRFLDIQPAHRKLEIGWTWLFPDYWGGSVNLECKLLLLTHCFEKLNAVRVQLKTDENNLRSRKAIEKIGGQFEGIIRNDQIRDNGTNRNSAMYSIINTEWKDLKATLTERLNENTH